MCTPLCAIENASKFLISSSSSFQSNLFQECDVTIISNIKLRRFGGLEESFLNYYYWTLINSWIIHRLRAGDVNSEKCYLSYNLLCSDMVNISLNKACPKIINFYYWLMSHRDTFCLFHAVFSRLILYQCQLNN